MAFLHGDLDPNCGRQTESQDNGQEDLDFSYLFHYSRTEFISGGGDGEDSGNCSHPVLLSQQREDSYPPDPSQDTDHLSRSRAGLDPLELQANRQGLAPAPSPRIEITPSWEPFQPLSLDCSPSSTALTAYREQQCLSPASSNSSTGWLAESNSPWASPCVSPSGGGGGVGSLAQDLCPGHQGLCTSSSHTSPGTSPRHSITEETFQLLQNQRISSPSPNPNSLSHLRSRSASPQGKRTYDQYSGTPGLGTPVYPRSRSPSPSPSPQIPLGSHHQLQPPAPLELQAQALPNLEELLSSPYRAVSSKMVRNSKESYVWGETQEEGNLFGDNQTQDSPYGDPGHQSSLYADTKIRVCEQERRGRPGTGPGARLDTLYVLPPTWSSPLANDGALSVPAVSSVLPLDWPVPSQAGKYHLQILQQPRSHHRAHYETEGSRGPVKAPGGGHPEVQLCGYRGSGPLGLLVFIGTADEKVTRPHAFYQVHRITGKTVTTPSLERTVHGTQALELTLEPSNNMRAVIDCAGILKLRNADIEMRNGETIIGRKNTRVSLVFRVHIPEPAGHVVTLQVASQPIECSQRSAQEYPRVENQDLECCSVLGGQQMILVGQNFTSESRVVFTEMTNEDVQMWEAEAKVDRDKSQPNILFVEVPPYRDLSLHQAVQVTFCVMNGRRKCSLYQPFTYTPLTAVKTEPVDDYQYSLLGCAVSQASRQAATPVYHTQSTHFTSSHHPVPGMAPFQHRGPVPNHSDSFYQAQYKPLPGYHPTSTSYAHQPPGSGAFTAGNPAQTTRPQLGHPGQAPQPGHQSQVLNFSHHAGVGALGSDHHQQTRPDDGQYLASVSPCFVGASPGASGGQRYRGYVQVQTVLPLGSSPPCYTQGLVHKDLEPRARSEQDQDHSMAQRGPAPSCLSRMIPGKITIKQENLNQNYLDDVNDLISSDL